MTLKITITQEDINNGVRLNSKACPICMALGRMGLINASVGYTGFYFEDSAGFSYEGRTNIPQKKFITDFDSRKKVMPFTTILRIDK